MATTKAIVLREHGGPDVLEEADIECPLPGPLEVQIEVEAVALNHLDLWVRRGGPAFKLEYPHRLGSDIAGRVAVLGAGVTGIAPGDEIVVHPGVSCGLCSACFGGRDNLCRSYRILGENTQGGYAERINVPRANVAVRPVGLAAPTAAAGMLSYLTAWQMLVRKADVRPGSTVLVHGAGGGVGVASLQIAKLHGAQVIATVGTDEKAERVRALGADHAINYCEQDFVAEVRAWTDKRGVDVVIDHIGGETLARSIRATTWGGRIVTCGATSAFETTIDLRHVFFRQISILGSTMGSKADQLEVLAHIAAGRLSPIVDRVLPLSRAAEAHRALEEREVFGKIVLEPRWRS